MAHRLQAVHDAYGPRTDLQLALTTDQILVMTIDITHQARSSGIPHPVEFDGVIEFDPNVGFPIHIYTPNCIIYTPSASLASELKANVWPHPQLTTALNQKDAFNSNLLNAGSITMWNTEHPDDLFEQEAARRFCIRRCGQICPLVCIALAREDRIHEQATAGYRKSSC